MAAAVGLKELSALESGLVYVTATLKAGHVMVLMCPDTLLQIRQNPVTQTVGLAVISLL